MEIYVKMCTSCTNKDIYIYYALCVCGCGWVSVCVVDVWVCGFVGGCWMGGFVYVGLWVCGVCVMSYTFVYEL